MTNHSIFSYTFYKILTNNLSFKLEYFRKITASHCVGGTPISLDEVADPFFPFFSAKKVNNSIYFIKDYPVMNVHRGVSNLIHCID